MWFGIMGILVVIRVDKGLVGLVLVLSFRSFVKFWGRILYFNNVWGWVFYYLVEWELNLDIS